MGFFDVAAEIRLKIYSELLVLSEPIDFEEGYGHSSPPLRRSQGDRLYPAVLRINRLVYSEAVPLLYSNNRFQFPGIFTSTLSTPTHAHIAPFLSQIGSQASFIRYIRIPFPDFNYPAPDRVSLHEVHIENLELIRKTCTNIKTLELLIPIEHCNYALNPSGITAQAFNLLDKHFKSILSLKEVVVNFEKYPESDSSDDLTKTMHDTGWTIRVTRLPKRVWISYDDRVEFDNREDRDAYDNEQFVLEQKREEEREDEEWLEEYYRRRRDPLWKNDSDYD